MNYPDHYNRIQALKKQSIFFMGLMILGVLASFYFYRQTSIAKEQLAESEDVLKKKNELLSLQKDTLEQVQATLKNQNRQIEVIRDSLAMALSSLNKSYVTNKRKYDEIEKLVKTSSNSDYYVAIYGFRLGRQTFEKVLDYLSKQHYNIDRKGILQRGESWFANQPTVFYYNKDHSEKAAYIAKELSGLTGFNFVEQMGAGHGIPKELMNNYFVIHLMRR